MKTSSDALIVGGVELHSRPFIGTGKYGPSSLTPAVTGAFDAEAITMTLRCVDLGNSRDNVLSRISDTIRFLPNTSDTRIADGAARIARLSRVAGCGDWIKIEVISDTHHLLPNGYETVRATETPAKEGFIALPYMSPNLYMVCGLMNVEAVAVMLLGMPTGTNRGLQTKGMVRILIEETSLPIVIDAGTGRPSQTCEAMEVGAAAYLVNTTIVTAGDPVHTGAASDKVVHAGRSAFLAKIGPVLQSGASAFSLLTRFLGGHDEGTTSWAACFPASCWSGLWMKWRPGRPRPRKRMC